MQAEFNLAMPSTGNFNRLGYGLLDFLSVLQQDHHLLMVLLITMMLSLINNLPMVLVQLVAQILNVLITQGSSLRILYAADAVTNGGSSANNHLCVKDMLSMGHHNMFSHFLKARDDKKPTLNYFVDYQVDVLKKMVNRDRELDIIEDPIKRSQVEDFLNALHLFNQLDLTQKK